LSDFTSTLLAGKQVQIRLDVGDGIRSLGVAVTFLYNPVKSEVTITSSNPNTGKLESQIEKHSKEEIIKEFSNLIFDSKTRTFKGVFNSRSVSGVYSLDGSLKSTNCASLGGKCGAPGLVGVKVILGAVDCPSSCYGGDLVPITPYPGTPTPTPTQLSDFTSTLLAGKQVQIRFDKGEGSQYNLGMVQNLLYNPATGDVTVNTINPNTGRGETKTEKNNKREDIINTFNRFIFDAKTRTFKNAGNEIFSGVYALDGSLKSTVPTTPSISCTDSDGGKNYDVKGVGKGIYTGKSSSDYYILLGIEPNPAVAKRSSDSYDTFVDHCLPDNKQLNEAYCENNKLTAYPYQCPNGCKDGVCLKPSEQKDDVKCVFVNSSDKEQKCYSDDGKFTCSGKGACIVTVSGEFGKKQTWKSTCGGYAYTTIDGNNEYAEFKCTTPTSPPQPTKLDLSKITGPSFGFLFVSYHNEALARDLSNEVANSGLPLSEGVIKDISLDYFVNKKMNYVLLNKDGSKRVVLVHKNAPAEDFSRSKALYAYYNSLPGVVARFYFTQDASLNTLFDFNPK
ncbi:MAG: hypothetical protein AABX39_06255, partial [Nanoarchaeota archaeon]